MLAYACKATGCKGLRHSLIRQQATGKYPSPIVSTSIPTYSSWNSDKCLDICGAFSFSSHLATPLSISFPPFRLQLLFPLFSPLSSDSIPLFSANHYPHSLISQLFLSCFHSTCPSNSSLIPPQFCHSAMNHTSGSGRMFAQNGHSTADAAARRCQMLNMRSIRTKYYWAREKALSSMSKFGRKDDIYIS